MSILSPETVGELPRIYEDQRTPSGIFWFFGNVYCGKSRCEK